tara:strand:+ start:743 stop:1147 length:405 start_codon:yes stop_codon:yes gene_type:complete
MGLENMKSRYDKSSTATQTEPFQSAEEALAGAKVGQTEPNTTNYFQTNNTLSPFDAQKLAKEDQLVKLTKDQTVTSAMSTQIYNPSEYTPLNLPGGDQDLDLGVNSANSITGQRGGKYDTNGPHKQQSGTTRGL